MFSKNYATIEDVWEHVYDARKFYAWFNMKPFVWMEFDGNFLEPGVLGRVYFLIPPFSYSLLVKEVIPLKKITLVGVSENFGGSASMDFYEDDDYVYHAEPHDLHSPYRLIELYYQKLLYPNHDWYMESRYKKLASILTREKRNGN